MPRPRTDQRPLPAANTRLRAAQARLLAAISSLDGLAESAIRPQVAQIDVMMQSLDAAEDRLRSYSIAPHPELDATQIDAKLHELCTKDI